VRSPLRLVLTASLASLAVAGAACSSAESGGGSTSGASGGFPVRIEHAMGTTVVDRAPVRVAALDASYVDAAIALQAQVVAFTSYRSIHGKLPDYLGAAAQTYGKDAVDVGTLTQPSIEKITLARPDLIVSAKVRHEAIYPQLSEIAPTIFSASTGPTWKDNIRLLARALGRQQLAEQLLSAYRARAKRIGTEIQTKLGRAPTASIVRFAGEATVRLYTTGSFPGSVLQDVGFARPADAPTASGIAADISAENIPRLDADYLFLSVYSDSSAQSSAARFKGNPLWSRLHGKIVDVADLTWFTSVSLQGANAMLDDLAVTFGVSP
jgi:iron complex transport system substrate-binding protein